MGLEASLPHLSLSFHPLYSFSSDTDHLYLSAIFLCLTVFFYFLLFICVPCAAMGFFSSVCIHSYPTTHPVMGPHRQWPRPLWPRFCAKGAGSAPEVRWRDFFSGRHFHVLHWCHYFAVRIGVRHSGRLCILDEVSGTFISRLLWHLVSFHLSMK